MLKSQKKWIPEDDSDLKSSKIMNQGFLPPAYTTQITACVDYLPERITTVYYTEFLSIL